MSLQLQTDEILQVLTDCKSRRAEYFREKLEALTTEMAQELALAFDCNTGPAKFEGVDLAGTCAPFRPRRHDQPCPHELSAHDDGGEDEWQDDAWNLCTHCGESIEGGEGYGGLCGNCADKAEAGNERA